MDPYRKDEMIQALAEVAVMAAVFLLGGVALGMCGTAPSRAQAPVGGIYDQAAQSCSLRRKRDPELMQSLREIEEDAGFPDEARGLLLAATCRETADRSDLRGDCKDTAEGRVCPSVGIVQFMPWARKRIEGSTMADPRLDPLPAARYWAKRFMRALAIVKDACTYVPFDFRGTRRVKWMPTGKGLKHKPTRSELWGSRAAVQVAAANAHSVWKPTKCDKYAPVDTRAAGLSGPASSRGGWTCVKRRIRCYGVTKHWRELRKWQLLLGVQTAER